MQHIGSKTQGQGHIQRSMVKLFLFSYQNTVESVINLTYHVSYHVINHGRVHINVTICFYQNS